MQSSGELPKKQAVHVYFALKPWMICIANDNLPNLLKNNHPQFAL
jgi:hypothetical protein